MCMYFKTNKHTSIMSAPNSMLPRDSSWWQDIREFRRLTEQIVGADKNLIGVLDKNIADNRLKIQAMQDSVDAMRLICEPIGVDMPTDLYKEVARINEFVEKNGGIENIISEVKAFDETDLNSIRSRYRRMLAQKGYFPEHAHLVDWDLLQGRGETGDARIRGFSVVKMMGSCESSIRNPDADPSKLHMQLALFGSKTETTRLYEIDVPGALKHVNTPAKARQALETVMEASNVKLLYDNDKAAAGGVDFDIYEESLRDDTERLLRFYTPDFDTALLPDGAKTRGKRRDYSNDGKGSKRAKNE